MASAGDPRSGKAQRSPRVQITYDVEIAGERRRRELPFVLGVLGNFAGNPEPPLPKLKDREFIEIGKGNFDAVLRNMQPRLAVTVANKLSGDDTKIRVVLRFRSLEDFEPEQVAHQVEPLRKLIELRRHLSALRATIRKNPELGVQVRAIVEQAAGNGLPSREPKDAP